MSVDDDEDGVRVYRIQGVLFFASITRFRDLFSPSDDPKKVALDFADARVADHSAIEAIASLAERYAKADKELHLRHLSPECRQLLSKARGVVDVDALTDPDYHVADDALGQRLTALRQDAKSGESQDAEEPRSQGVGGWYGSPLGSRRAFPT